MNLRPIAILLMLAVAMPAAAQLTDPDESIPEAPPRSRGEGPFERLILRGVTLIDGTGAPPVGPIDIVVEQNRITEIRSVGFPGVRVQEEGRPQAQSGDKVLELDGHYVMPGFVDLHGHIGGTEQGTPAEYVLKLWMGHGISDDLRSVDRQRPAMGPRSQGQERGQRDHRASHRGLPRFRPRPAAAGLDAGRGSRVGQRNRGHGRRRHQVLRRPSRHHGSGDRRSEQERLEIDVPPRAAQRVVAGRARLRPARPHLDATLVRASRGAVSGPHRPGLPGRLQLQQRAASFRSRPAGCGSKPRRKAPSTTRK